MLWGTSSEHFPRGSGELIPQNQLWTIPCVWGSTRPLLRPPRHGCALAGRSMGLCLYSPSPRVGVRKHILGARSGPNRPRHFQSQPGSGLAGSAHTQSNAIQSWSSSVQFRSTWAQPCSNAAEFGPHAHMNHFGEPEGVRVNLAELGGVGVPVDGGHTGEPEAVFQDVADLPFRWCIASVTGTSVHARRGACYVSWACTCACSCGGMRAWPLEGATA